MGGGAPSIPQRSFGQELPQIGQGYGFQENQYLNFTQKDPLLQAAYGNIQNVLQPSMQDFIAPVLSSGGQLSPEQIRDVTQNTLGPYAARGNAVGEQAYAAQLLNRDQYRQQRYAQALSEFGQTQGQTLGTERAGVQSFTELNNPILGYLQDLFSSNQNALATQNIAGANKGSGALGTGLSLVGSAAAAY
jgi:hypothetical protein